MNPHQPRTDDERLTVMLTTGTEHAWRATGARTFGQRLREPGIDPAWYIGSLQSMHAVAQALESRVRSARTDRRLGPLIVPGLARAEALEADLRFFGAAPGRPSEASLRYVAHIYKLAVWSPMLLVAHVWTRTLAVMDGAEQQREGVRAAFGLTGAAGTSLFDFHGVDSRAWRDRFDALPLALADREMLVAEAVHALELGAALTPATPARIALAA
jgi:heme oxygenase